MPTPEDGADAVVFLNGKASPLLDIDPHRREGRARAPDFDRAGDAEREQSPGGGELGIFGRLDQHLAGVDDTVTLPAGSKTDGHDHDDGGGGCRRLLIGSSGAR
jgi:hypothetical protein